MYEDLQGSAPARRAETSAVEFESPTRLPRALRVFHETVIAEDGPYPLDELEPSLRGAEHHHSRRPCHLRATSSGHEYAVDRHGALEKAARLGTPLT